MDGYKESVSSIHYRIDPHMNSTQILTEFIGFQPGSIPFLIREGGHELLHSTQKLSKFIPSTRETIFVTDIFSLGTIHTSWYVRYSGVVSQNEFNDIFLRFFGLIFLYLDILFVVFMGLLCVYFFWFLFLWDFCEYVFLFVVLFVLRFGY